MFSHTSECDILISFFYTQAAVDPSKSFGFIDWMYYTVSPLRPTGFLSFEKNLFFVNKFVWINNYVSGSGHYKQRPDFKPIPRQIHLSIHYALTMVRWLGRPYMNPSCMPNWTNSALCWVWWRGERSNNGGLV